MKILSAIETEIYEGDTGYICIRQRDSGEEHTIILTPGQARLIADRLFLMVDGRSDLIVSEGE